MGVLINGCGTSDKCIPLKSLGSFTCPHCKASRNFSLMRVENKAKVFFVPVATLNTKYAVLCTACETGVYVEENTKDKILSGEYTVRVEDGEFNIYKNK